MIELLVFLLGFGMTTAVILTAREWGRRRQWQAYSRRRAEIAREYDERMKQYDQRLLDHHIDTFYFAERQ